MGLTPQVGMANGATLMAARLSLLHRLWRRVLKWLRQLRQLSVLLLWLLPMAVALAQQARQYLRHQRSRLQGRGLEMYRRLSQLLQRLAHQLSRLPLAAHQLSQRAQLALQLQRYSLALRLSSRPQVLRQAAAKLGSQLQRSVLRAWSRLPGRSSGKANLEPAPAGQRKQTQTQPTPSNPAPAQIGKKLPKRD